MTIPTESAQAEWEVVPNPARRVTFWLAIAFGVLLIVCCANAIDGFQDYAERSDRCASVGWLDDDVRNRCQDALADVNRGGVSVVFAVPCLFMAGLFWALHATRDPYRQRLAEPSEQ